MTVLVFADDEIAGKYYVDHRAWLTGENSRNFKVVAPGKQTEGLRADEVVMLTNNQALRDIAQRIIATVARITVTYPRRGAL